MSDRLIPLRLGDVEVFVEVSPGVGSESTSTVADAAARLSESFARSQQAIVEMAVSTADMVRKATSRGARPDELVLEFGLRFSAQGHVIVASVAGEATLTVRLAYDGRRAESGHERH